jgi:hypothetical protein
MCYKKVSWNTCIYVSEATVSVVLGAKKKEVGPGWRHLNSFAAELATMQVQYKKEVTEFYNVCKPKIGVTL